VAELSLRERLQPALFDRLIDDERLLTLYELTVRRADLQRLGLSERDLSGILTGQGLTADGEPDILTAIDGATSVRLKFTAPGGRVAPSQLKALVLKPPGMPQGVALQSFCEVAARNVRNETAESGEQRSVSMRKLREYVCRDLAALLNCGSLDASLDLTHHPHVQHSVVNYGMPSLAGRTARMVDPQQIAASIKSAIARFEPRLSQLRVTAELGQDGQDTHVLAFRIEAQLWGQPAPQQLVLRTSIDVDTGDVSFADSGMR
jgi:type VI secretion system protein ImpF